MASSFAESSHRKWLQSLQNPESNRADVEQLSLASSSSSSSSSSADERRRKAKEDVRLMKVNYIMLLHALGKQLRLRQSVTATGMVYFWRFYVKHSFCSEFQVKEESSTSLLFGRPDYVAPACLSLACKVAECPLPSTGVLLAALQAVVSAGSLHYGIVSLNESMMKVILKHEFLVLEALNCDLILFHPYEYLTRNMEVFANKFSGFSNEEVNDCLQLSWNITNDSFRTDACLRYAPSIIALAALYIAATKLRFWEKGREVAQYWERIDADITRVKQCAADILNMYARGVSLNVGQLNRIATKLFEKTTSLTPNTLPKSK